MLGDDALSGGAHDAPDGSHASSATSDGADEDANDKGGVDPDDLRAADLLDIIGESWANARRILDSYGVDQADLVINTDDGGMVWNPANWTVTLVTDLDEPGRISCNNGPSQQALSTRKPRATIWCAGLPAFSCGTFGAREKRGGLTSCRRDRRCPP